MPRNGDESGDSGPYEAHEIVHGTSGDTTLQHTKHVAPMPKLEEGNALPGLNASGGAAAPLNDASEEYGATVPRNEQFGSEDSASKIGASKADNDKTATSSSSQGSRATATGQQNNSKSSSSSQETKSEPSYGQSSGHSTHDFHKDHGKHDLEHVSREKAERYVNLNEEDVQHASGDSKSGNGAERSSQRAPRDVGPKEDIEQLHGKADAGKGDDKSEEHDSKKTGKADTGKSEERSENRDSEKTRKQGSISKGSGNGGDEHDSHEEDPMRHNAAKFLNIDG